MKTNIQITTSNDFGESKIKEYKGLVSAKIVVGANFFADFFASFTDVFGGRSGAYQSRLNEIYDDAIEQISEEAERRRANGIIALSVDFDEISGKDKSMFMVSVIGTAVDVEFAKAEDNSTGANFTTVSKEQLESAVRCEFIKMKLDHDDSLNESDWKYICGYKDVAERLIVKYGQTESDEYTDNLVMYFSSLDYDSACDVLYGNFNGNKKARTLIYKCFLFNPQKTLELLDRKANMSDILWILTYADKHAYNSEDMLYMERICHMLDNLPDRVEYKKVVSGLFTKTEKEVCICANGHEMATDAEFCPSCYVDRKGFTKADKDKIVRFKIKTRLLKEMLGISE